MGRRWNEEASHDDENLDEGVPGICKEDNCRQKSTVKGFCRLHFLKVLAGKSSANKNQKNRRQGGRLVGPDAEFFLSNGEGLDREKLLHDISQIDTDVDVVDVETLMPQNYAGKVKKVG